MNKVNNIYSEKMGRHLLRKGISLGTFIDPFTQVQDLGVHQITIVHIRNVGMIEQF